MINAGNIVLTGNDIVNGMELSGINLIQFEQNVSINGKMYLNSENQILEHIKLNSLLQKTRNSCTLYKCTDLKEHCNINLLYLQNNHNNSELSRNQNRRSHLPKHDRTGHNRDGRIRGHFKVKGTADVERKIGTIFFRSKGRVNTWRPHGSTSA